MRKHENYEDKGNILRAKFIVPIVVLILGFVAFNIVTRDRSREAGTEGDVPAVSESQSNEIPQAGPVPLVDDEGGTWISNPDAPIVAVDPVTVEPAQTDQFAEWGDRVKQFGFASGTSSALRRSVEKYGAAREYQCSGNIVVRTVDTSLNIRSGPATSNPVVAKASKGASYPVLMWANDEGSSGSRWFLLVDERRKVVRGWVSGEYCDSTGVTFAN
ncbi:MAG: SH3 domain-containing protein [Synergistaceae bacterium]|nr:SH3 domain-containing protein [Synergistaceae bacterium]